MIGRRTDKRCHEVALIDKRQIDYGMEVCYTHVVAW